MAKAKGNNRILYILLIVVGGLIALAIIGKSAGWIGKPKQLEVELGSTKRVDITEKVSASGTVQPVTEVKISPDVSGEIMELTVEEGDSVSKGEFLIRIRPDNYESALSRVQANLNQQSANYADAKARLSSSEAQLVRSELEYNRSKKLYEEKVISDADWEQIQANYKVAKQNVESAKQSVEAGRFLVISAEATVREAKENLRLTTINSPVSGTVSKLNVEKGERVVGTSQMQGTEMLRIADLREMEVRVDVNENDIIRVSVGDTAIIDVDSYTYMDKKFKGIVTAIANTAKDKTSPDAVTEFEVKIKILSSSYQDLLKGKKMVSPFRPGMTASVEIITNRRSQVLAVPLSAVTTRNPEEEKEGGKRSRRSEGATEGDDKKVNKKNENKEVVFVNKEGKAEMRLVKTGISDYENIEILEGLSDGEEIVTGPFIVISKRIKDGEMITSQKKEEKKKEEKAETEEKE
ncbi:efflux RND transporter periplasmic adaptor subunit [Cytophagales bacterium LB-30]|uniref:Efflux RND transporter periplasmic adaptor subunit n=1 Tax=Shiella aurantiaca TaxID=3058365 RepID=A0ABT8F853_9BACT|nr:biotin/lipoyl-binding protein [Shiella aurantiaca]MDN4166657.1 efflux RND transporter periplasmic adaptor subunit [Shiella aurantiaca]